jgi:hypothetical protein
MLLIILMTDYIIEISKSAINEIYCRNDNAHEWK